MVGGERCVVIGDQWVIHGGWWAEAVNAHDGCKTIYLTTRLLSSGAPAMLTMHNRRSTATNCSGSTPWTKNVLSNSAVGLKRVIPDLSSPPRHGIIVYTNDISHIHVCMNLCMYECMHAYIYIYTYNCIIYIYMIYICHLTHHMPGIKTHSNGRAACGVCVTSLTRMETRQQASTASQAGLVIVPGAEGPAMARGVGHLRCLTTRPLQYGAPAGQEAST